MVDKSVENIKMKGLTEEENRALNGVLNPSKSFDKTRPNFLKVEKEYLENC